jgi:hypothetical protein
MKCHGWFGCTFGFAAPIIEDLAVSAVVGWLAPELLPFLQSNQFLAGIATATLQGAAVGAVNSDGNLNTVLISAGEAGAFSFIGGVTHADFDEAGGTNSSGQTIEQWAAKDPGEFAANIAGHGLVGG